MFLFKSEKDEESQKSIYTFSDLIEKKIELNKSIDNCICITKNSYLEIDEIRVDVFVEKKNDLYNYEIISFDIISSNENNTDLYLLIKYNFSTIVELLIDLENVKKTYRFLEHKLLSPFEFEFAKFERDFFNLPSDKICSVCYEYTIEYTICNHPICFKCRCKCIKSNTKRCPICRTKKLSKFPELLEY